REVPMRQISKLMSVMLRMLHLGSEACRESALHGLNHRHFYYPKTVERAIDAFLSAGAALATGAEGVCARSAHGAIAVMRPQPCSLPTWTRRESRGDDAVSDEQQIAALC